MYSDDTVAYIHCTHMKTVVEGCMNAEKLAFTVKKAYWKILVFSCINLCCYKYYFNVSSFVLTFIIYVRNSAVL